MWLKESMNECWKGSLKIKREGNHWFENEEDFMEEALSLASSTNSSKDWLDSDRKKRGDGGLFRYKEKGKEMRVCLVCFVSVNEPCCMRLVEGKMGPKIGIR